MRTWDLIKVANRNLFRNKLRTFLTVMAIFVGSFTLTMTNGLGDGMRDYVESQVKNIEGDRVIMVRKKVERPVGGPRAGTPAEYKGDVGPEGGSDFDPNSILMTLPQMEAAVKEIDGVKSITPRYNIEGEYISIDGGKKYQLELGMLSEGITAKTEAGGPLSGDGQIVIPIGLARAMNSNISELIGKPAAIGYKLADGTMKTISLEIVGVATKGFMTNYSSFVSGGTARQIHEDQRPNGRTDSFIAFTLQLNSNDPAIISNAKSKLSAAGYEGDTIADNDKRTYDAIGIFKTGMNPFAFVALLAASFGDR